MMMTVAERLAQLGWSRTNASAVRSTVRVKGQDRLAPWSKDIGPEVLVTDVLPPGARVVVEGEGEGRIEYGPRGYIRLRPNLDHDSPMEIARLLIDVNASVEYPEVER